MRRIWMLVPCLILSSYAATQDQKSEPKISDEPLTADQIAVYRAVLRDYLKDSDGSLNLANVTEPLDQSNKSCFEASRMEITDASALVIHRLGSSLVANTKIVLVDSDLQQSTIKENDPQNLIKRAIDDGEKFTDEQLDQSLKKAFQNGLFTLTEIIFDRRGRRAVVGYSFVCGMLCGHGNTLVLKKDGKDWKVSKRCGGWIS